MNHPVIALMLAASAVAVPLAACAGDDVLYDPYRHDYHRWDGYEARIYRQWELNTRRNHLDINRRPYPGSAGVLELASPVLLCWTPRTIRRSEQ